VAPKGWDDYQAAIDRLTGHGTRAMMPAALRPTAVALAVVTALRLARGGDCLARHGGVAEATVDEPATLSWTLRRGRHAVDPRCGRTLAGRPAAGRPTAGGVRSMLRLRGRRRPGTYRLTATARNAHGRGHSRTLWLTVA
jgi:hypothetical protein